jgi:LppP/LprE lipoprotein
MQNTSLAAEPLERFVPSGPSKTTPDGSGGMLTAAVGTVVPTTDGMGQLVFFWHNTRFVGWDAPDASMAIQALSPVGTGGFRVTYANYTSNDPACCPSLGPVSVLYRWRGGHFAINGSPPSVRPIPARVRFSG